MDLPVGNVNPGTRDAFAFDAETAEVGSISVFKAEWREESLRVYENARIQALADMEAEKTGLLAGARDEAERALAAAGRDAEAIRDRARIEGEARGFAAGAERARSLLASIESGCAEAERIRTSAFRDAEEELVELSLAIARRVIASACENSRAVVKETLSKAMSALSGARPLVLSVSPRDRETVVEILGKEGEGRALRVEADPSISPGGCRLETDAGWIDARIESMLAAMEAGLRGSGQPAGTGD
jgi:flagellar assembly protein FliH